MSQNLAVQHEVNKKKSFALKGANNSKGSGTGTPRKQSTKNIDSEGNIIELKQKFVVVAGEKSLIISFGNARFGLQRTETGALSKTMRGIEAKDNTTVQAILDIIKPYCTARLTFAQVAARLQKSDVEGFWAQTYKQYQNRLSKPLEVQEKLAVAAAVVDTVVETETNEAATPVE